MRPYPRTDEMLDEVREDLVGLHAEHQGVQRRGMEGQPRDAQDLMTSYGYLLHDFFHLTNSGRSYGHLWHPRRVLASQLDGIDKVRPYHWIDGNAEGEKRFIMEGYTEDRRVVVFGHPQGLEIRGLLQHDFRRVHRRRKGATSVRHPQAAQEIAINTNYTIPAVTRSDRRRLHFVPIGQFYGVLSDPRARRQRMSTGDGCSTNTPGLQRTGLPSM